MASIKDKKNGWKLAEFYGRDMHSGTFYEAICPHGVGHHKGVHGCDGCCGLKKKAEDGLMPCPKRIWDRVTEEK